jgi:hypothetical protein
MVIGRQLVSTKGTEKGIHYEVYDFKTGEINDKGYFDL